MNHVYGLEAPGEILEIEVGRHHDEENDPKAIKKAAKKAAKKAKREKREGRSEVTIEI